MAVAAIGPSLETGKMPDGFLSRRSRLTAVATVWASLIFIGSGTAPNPISRSEAHAEGTRPVGFADIVEKIKPAVVSVRVKIDAAPRTTTKRTAPPSDETPLERFLRRFGVPEGGVPRGPVTNQGSGFFVTSDGYAVTNNHVVDAAKNVEITTDDGKTYTAKVIGTDERTDVALIKVDGRSDFSYAKFATGNPRVGDWVLAVGNPFGLGGTVTAGIVSARGRDLGSGPYDDFIQIDAPVNKGNSGGPTFDVDGNVIGVNTAIVSPSGGSVGIAFAIPAETVETVVNQLKTAGKVTRGWIGVQIQDVTADIADNLGLRAARGALVAEPQANGPAAKAGIEKGDVVTTINDKEIGDSREAARTIGAMVPGTAVKLTVLRNGQQRTFNIVLGELPPRREATVVPETREPRGTNLSQLGFAVAPKPGGDGVVVTNVDPNGPAAEHGFKVGDTILDAAGRKLGNAGDLRNALQAAQNAGKRSVLLRVKSGDAMRFVTLPIGRG